MSKISEVDTRDFEDSYKFKYIMPSLYILGWVSLFLGPFYYPVFNQLICFIVLLIASCKYMMFGLMSFYLLYQNWRVLRRAQNPNKQKREEVGQEVYHAIIIPNYREHIQLICETLNVMANHSRSKESYFIYLAMQKHEKDSDKKAKQIMSEFKGKFRHMDFTCHEVQPL